MGRLNCLRISYSVANRRGLKLEERGCLRSNAGTTTDRGIIARGEGAQPPRGVGRTPSHKMNVRVYRSGSASRPLDPLWI